MENKNDSALAIFSGFGFSEEERKAHEKRMLEKTELCRNIERVANKLVAVIEADVDSGKNSPLYNFKASAEALHEISSALVQYEIFANMQTSRSGAGWSTREGE